LTAAEYSAPQIAEVSALGYKHLVHKHLRRLECIWVDAPIYCITTCTRNRRRVLAQDDFARILIAEWHAAHRLHGWAVGRYVIMPDHVHFFCRPERDAKSLPDFVGFWKSYTSHKINALGRPPVSARGYNACGEFFDHLLRSNESYSQKWNYVRDNPVRAGLVSSADDWPYAGEIETLML
jgi:REP element-mobilizing transposase RayT